MVSMPWPVQSVERLPDMLFTEHETYRSRTVCIEASQHRTPAAGRPYDQNTHSKVRLHPLLGSRL